jgi:peptidoglycan-associated lipoprotein
MVRKSMWLILLVSMVGMGLIASGCAKKNMVKVGVAPEPVVPMNRDVNPGPYVAVQKPQQQNPLPADNAAPVVTPKEESNTKAEERPARMAVKPKVFDLEAFHIQFAFDDYNLSSTSEKNLNRIAAWMKSHPANRIQIQGYTCDIGTDEYNLALGDQRAKNAEKYLEAMGVDRSRLSTISYGKENPRVPNTDESHRAMNRRDDFVMMN